MGFQVLLPMFHVQTYFSQEFVSISSQWLLVIYNIYTHGDEVYFGLALMHALLP